MLKNQHIAIIGAGNIGRALLGGLIKGPEIEAKHLRVTRRNPVALADLAVQFPGIQTFASNAEAVQGAQIVIVCVKPQHIQHVIDEVASHLEEEALLISVLAGMTTQTLAGMMGRQMAVIRAMPNTPALVDEAATAICKGEFASDRDLERAHKIFEAVGQVEVVPEYLMDAVTGLSGSGPAYIYMVIEALTDGGVKQGLPRPTALKLAAQTVYGAAKLVIETGKHPAILRDEVTTPGGTTINAIAELEAHGLRPMLIDAVATATHRSKELNAPGGKE